MNWRLKKIMSLVNIISAIGNNNSVYPLLVRDCGVENPIKIALTYKQNIDESPKVARYAVRERTIDEYTTSAVWLGAIPVVEAASDMFISKKGYNPKISARLFKEDAVKNPVQGIEFNIKKFANSTSKEVQAAVADLIKVRDNKKAFESLVSKKFTAAVAIPMALIGFIIPKCIFALSRKIAEKEKQNQPDYSDILGMSDITTFGQKKDVSFTGFASTVATLTTPDKMAAIDGGYAVGRVLTARKGYEPFDIAFKMAGMLYLNYVAPKQIEKLFNFTSARIFKSNVNLDPKLLNNKEFISDVENNRFDFLGRMNGAQMLEYIDNNPQSPFTKYASMFKKVTMLTQDSRDPRIFVDIKDLENFGKDIFSFSKDALNSKNLTKFAKKALRVKSGNIISNVALSSFLLSYVLPKTQFALRELFTGSKLEPGLINIDNKKR